MSIKEIEERNKIYLRFAQETDVIKKFNIFLELFCANDLPHLIDNDDNAGEEMRQAIKSYAVCSSKHELESGRYVY